MRSIQINHNLQYTNLRRYFISVAGITRRYNVHRATAYRYLRKIPPECKIKVRMGEGKPYTMGMITALDRVHERAKRGNPRLTPDHQKRAASLRWPQIATNPEEKP